MVAAGWLCTASPCFVGRSQYHLAATLAALMVAVFTGPYDSKLCFAGIGGTAAAHWRQAYLYVGLVDSPPSPEEEVAAAHELGLLFAAAVLAAKPATEAWFLLANDCSLCH
jgi:hypothetical protein